MIWQKYYLRRDGWSTLGKALERADVREGRWIGGPVDRVKVSQLVGGEDGGGGGGIKEIKGTKVRKTG